MLKCKLCNYTAKQLFQHLKAQHNLTTNEYRIMYGTHLKVQDGFTAPQKLNIKRKNTSKQIKKSYQKVNRLLELMVEFYTKYDTRNLLLTSWKTYIGKTKYRTLIKDDIKLYGSINKHTQSLTALFNRKLTLTEKLIFIVEYNYDVAKLKCACGKKYTFGKYCRYCPAPKRTQLNKSHTLETKQKMRISTIEYIESAAGNCYPRYNINSIPLIEEYGKKHGYNFKHAENGGEYHIKKLGYFVDGYDKEKNVVIEIDEKHHFNVDDILKKKDVIRQQEIENFL